MYIAVFKDFPLAQKEDRRENANWKFETKSAFTQNWKVSTLINSQETISPNVQDKWMKY